MIKPHFDSKAHYYKSLIAVIGLALLGVLTLSTSALSRQARYDAFPDALSPLTSEGKVTEPGVSAYNFFKPDLQTFISVHLLADEEALGKRLPRDQKDAIAQAYEARQYKPIWLNGNIWNEAAQSALRVLREADMHGLSSEDYHVSLPVTQDIDMLAEAEVRLSIAVVTYARDARGARLDRRKIGTFIIPAISFPSASEILSTVAEAKEDAGSALEAYHPRSSQYKALRTKLIALQEIFRQRAASSLDAPPSRRSSLKEGIRDARIPMIRERLGLKPVKEAQENTFYDAQLTEAVSRFQKEAGFPATGEIDPDTLIALFTPQKGAPISKNDIAHLIMAIRINMERWRWFPHDLGDKHLLVNLPEQSVKIIENNEVIHQFAAIIGKNVTPTPVFSGMMRYVVVNPSWYVPQSIVKQDILPKLVWDPDYTARQGYKVKREGKNVTVWQPPGPRNALGRIKFVFPNDQAIYLHDTPNRELFKKNVRTLSHGCIRVDKPLLLAEYVLGSNWPQQRLERIIGNKERSLRLEQPLPIHLTYFTLDVNSKGEVSFFPDIYTYDQRMKLALERLDRARVESASEEVRDLAKQNSKK